VVSDLLKLAIRMPPVTDEELREGRRRLKLAGRAAGVGCWEWDLATGVTTWTEESLQLLGYPPESDTRLLDGLLASCHPADRGQVRQRIESTLRTNLPFQVDYRMVLPDGRERWRRVEAEVFRDANHRPIRLCGTLQDVTDRKRLESVVVGERNVLEMIARGAPLTETLEAIALLVEDRAEGMLVSVLLVDEEGRLHLGAAPSLPAAYNEAIEGAEIGPKAGSCGTAAWRRETVVTTDIATDPLWEDYRELALRHGLASSWSTPLCDPGGTVIGTLAQYYREPRDPTPSDLRLIAIAQHLAEIAIQRHRSDAVLRAAHADLERRVAERTEELARAIAALRAQIEARGAAERGLLERERSLIDAQQLAHCGSWEWDVENDRVLWSDELYRIFGVSVQGLPTTLAGFLASVVPEDRPGVEESIRRSFETHEPFAGEERIMRPDGTIRHLVTRGHVEVDADGRVVRMTGSCADATEQKKAEAEIRSLNSELEARVAERTQQLQAANRELEAFSYAVSHDLRAPLRSIDGFSAILLEDYTDKLDEPGVGYLRRVRAATLRMSQLIDDILLLSRVTRSELHGERIDLTLIATEVAEGLRASAPSRLVTFEIAPGVVAQGDARLLRAALENLLGNAWKFTSHHTTARIEFGVLQEDGVPVYFVRDDGVGFDMRFRNELFRPFTRLHGSDGFEGTGVGLATVQRIIQRHGGRIWAEGAEERGATFYFTLHEGQAA
jgi:PAS domain S-box-containing protein